MRKEQEGQMGIMDRGENVDIRQPSINTEPRTLNDMKMECAMVIFEGFSIWEFFSSFRVALFGKKM